MAATTSTPSTEPQPVDTNNVGIFQSKIGLGYVEPTRDELNAFLDHIDTLKRPITNHKLFHDLLTIKLLAPEKSGRVMIYNHGYVVGMIRQISAKLVEQYRRG